jgi:hypothetical protein
VVAARSVVAISRSTCAWSLPWAARLRRAAWSRSLEALALARRGGAFTLVGQALARVGVPLAFVGDPFAPVGDAVTPARHPLPGVRLPFALLALSRHDAIVPGRRVPSS